MDFLGVALLIAVGIMALVHILMVVLLIIAVISGGGIGFLIIALINVVFTVIYIGAFFYILDLL